MSDPITDHIVRAVRAAVCEELQACGYTLTQRLLTLEQAAEYLGCSPNQVRNLKAEGIIRRFTWPIDQERKEPYYDRVDLDRRIDQIKEQNSGSRNLPNRE